MSYELYSEKVTKIFLCSFRAAIDFDRRLEIQYRGI